ncbi:MAG TPA: MBL fold metallo-hydrolase [Jatrophihabitantaceae bacterium]|nr:MBL fold metallo-hydrolase [Jatrophihabitantaceae bacterium]
MTHPAYETLRQVTPLAAVVLAANPSPMTLEGTNTWLLRAPGADASIVVDPGPHDEVHMSAITAVAGRVEQILLTHGHPDHSDGARRLHELTGAPVRALDPAHRLGDEGLGEADVVASAGVEVRVLATPGHSADSLSFVLDAHGNAPRSVLTGDTILGRGTTVVAYPDGDLAEYLASLRRLQQLGDATVLTGHGPELPNAADVATYYLAHRRERLDQVRAALAELGPDASPRAVVEVVYADVDRVLWWAAELSVRAQLAYLREHEHDPPR